VLPAGYNILIKVSNVIRWIYLQANVRPPTRTATAVHSVNLYVARSYGVFYEIDIN